jgi:hypothetical protein
LAPINSNLQKQLSSMLSPVIERLRGQIKVSRHFSAMAKSWAANQATLNLISPAASEMLKNISEQNARFLAGLQTSIGSFIDPTLFQGLKLSFLPANLQDIGDEIRFSEIHEFIEQEGIPLYLVPRGRTAVRLLRATDRSARRRVLGNCFETLMDDCEAVLTNVTHPSLREEVSFALDGLGAMRAGHTRSAQAMFTVTLDTLIYRFYPDRSDRKAVTNRKKDADVPESFDEMGVREAMVWLPIWNAHEQFWKDKGDEIPRYYSRHASVHGVSSRQFSKRNCVQVLMLVTSLIGYAEQVMS